MKWNPAVPEKLFVASCESTKPILLHAMWLAISEGCLSNKDEALDMCLTYINEARRADGRKPISRETIETWVKEREDARAKIALARIP